MSNCVSVSFSGDSFTQFRFSEEKDWEMDSLAASQVNLQPADLNHVTNPEDDSQRR